MNHVCRRSLSDKEKILNVFSKQLQTMDKNCCSVNRSTADRRCLNHHSKADGQHKMKRLKSRKERSKIRGSGNEALKSKSHHHLYRPQTSKDMTQFYNCCHSSCHCPSRRDALFPNVIPAAQEPSFITDSRLIGHHGLFNHEVKSIDIERLLSEQKKLKKSEKQVQEKSNATSRPSSTSPVLSPFSTNDLLGADTNEVMPLETKADPATKAHDDCQKKDKVSQVSDLTPGQRPLQQLDVSSGSFKSVCSSEQSSFDVVMSKTNPVMSEKGRDAQLTPTVDRENVKTLNKKVKACMISTLEHTPKIQESPVHHTQALGLSPSPLQLSSSHMADRFDTQHRRQDLDCSKSVSAMAAGLCDSLQFPLLRRRSLVEESREALLKVLQEKHGSQLQENLLEVQQCISFGSDPAKEVQDKEPAMVDEDELLPLEANTVSWQRFGTKKTTSLSLKRSRHVNWKSSPQLHHNLKQTAKWLTSPVKTSVSLLDDIFRPTRSPQFCMDFEPSGVPTSDHLFAPPPASCWGEKGPQHWEDRFSRPKSKEAVMFGSFENSFMNHTRAVTERSSGSQYSDSNIQPFFPLQAQLPHRHPTEPVHFPHQQDPFDADRYSFAPSFSGQIHHPQHHLQPFSQFSQPSTYPPFRSHHTDMMHYPPSHMLESNPAPPLSSFPSPEHWSFPPMRLY